MQIAIGSDHAGYEYKSTLILHLKEKGYEVLDQGPFDSGSVDYPDFIHPVSKLVSEGKARFGVIICGSGNGAAMTANKYPDIRAALCWIREIAVLARKHNNANIISLPARYISVTQAIEMVDAFLNTEFEGGRHERRVQKIKI